MILFAFMLTWVVLVFGLLCIVELVYLRAVYLYCVGYYLRGMAVVFLCLCCL